MVYFHEKRLIGPAAQENQIWLYANSNGTDQPVHPHTPLSTFLINFLECTVIMTCADPESFVRGVPTLTAFFFFFFFLLCFSVDEGGEDPNTT